MRPLRLRNALGIWHVKVSGIVQNCSVIYTLGIKQSENVKWKQCKIWWHVWRLSRAWFVWHSCETFRHYNSSCTVERISKLLSIYVDPGLWSYRCVKNL